MSSSLTTPTKPPETKRFQGAFCIQMDYERMLTTQGNYKLHVKYMHKGWRPKEGKT